MSLCLFAVACITLGKLLKLEAIMDINWWWLPLIVLGAIFAIRLLLTPYWIYKKIEKERNELQSQLQKDKDTPRLPSPPEIFQGALETITKELTNVMVSKQHDYGSANITEFGEFGVLVRANDKMARLKNLIDSENAPNNESIEDTWKDLANYSIIALMLRRGWWELPLE